MPLNLRSPAFEDGDVIPKKYTCDGEDVSPPLAWSNPPQGTQSFAIIFDDPDAPGKTWVHWVLYNIPGDVRKLRELVPAVEILANGTVHGTNDYQKRSYRGPCPPGERHHYSIRLYALDEELDLKPGATKKELMSAMKGHILEEAQLTATYSRQS
ncbi:MAG: YbhB/YbcL family Raf kinase inhibitor-like protein [Balneolaceae bacterium]|nr:YbhB/YbcL family Raf kinase inhibitor-like protein [Balneolaceae bacterium]